MMSFEHRPCPPLDSTRTFQSESAVSSFLIALMNLKSNRARKSVRHDDQITVEKSEDLQPTALQDFKVAPARHPPKKPRAKRTENRATDAYSDEERGAGGRIETSGFFEQRLEACHACHGAATPS